MFINFIDVIMKVLQKHPEGFWFFCCCLFGFFFGGCGLGPGLNNEQYSYTLYTLKKEHWTSAPS